MAAITIAASALTLSAGCTTITGTSGEAISVGMPVYLKAADGLYYKCDSNLSLAAATCVGLCVGTVLISSTLTVVTAGSVNLGATLTVGGVYVVGATVAGDIDLVADLATGWYVSILGVASTAALLDLHIVNSGVIHA